MAFVSEIEGDGMIDICMAVLCLVVVSGDVQIGVEPPRWMGYRYGRSNHGRNRLRKGPGMALEARSPSLSIIRSRKAHELA